MDYLNEIILNHMDNNMWINHYCNESKMMEINGIVTDFFTTLKVEREPFNDTFLLHFTIDNKFHFEILLCKIKSFHIHG